MGKLKREVEKAKRTLSSQQSTKIEIEAFEGGNDFSETLTRAKFEELNIDLFRKTMKPVEQVLKDAGVKKEAVDEIVLVGGSTRIPKVQSLLQEYFGKAPSKAINPDEAVAYGAAVQGGILSGEAGTEDVVLIDVRPSYLPLRSSSDLETDSLSPAAGQPAHARYRDDRRRHDQAHPAQHGRPDQEVADLFDRGRQPADRPDPGL
jgi:heat shock protein 5